MTGRRVASIDALRGLVMLLMLVDHVRETVYLHAQVGDPVDVLTTPPGLFLTRSLSHVCAPGVHRPDRARRLVPRRDPLAAGDLGVPPADGA